MLDGLKYTIYALIQKVLCMQIPVNEIKIRKRVRKENTDIDSLVESIRRNGLLNPITVSADYELIAGFRRLSAVKQLGWERIEAVVIDVPVKSDALEIELEENTQRLQFTAEELEEANRRISLLQRNTLFQRILRYLTEFFTEAFDRISNRQEEKHRRNGVLSLFAPAGILGIAINSLCWKAGYFSSILHSLLDFMFFCTLIAGFFYFIRYCIGLRK